MPLASATAAAPQLSSKWSSGEACAVTGGAVTLALAGGGGRGAIGGAGVTAAAVTGDPGASSAVAGCTVTSVHPATGVA